MLEVQNNNQLNQSQQKRKTSLGAGRGIFRLRFRKEWRIDEAELYEKASLKAKKNHLFKTETKILKAERKKQSVFGEKKKLGDMGFGDRSQPSHGGSAGLVTWTRQFCRSH